MAPLCHQRQESNHQEPLVDLDLVSRRSATKSGQPYGVMYVVVMPPPPPPPQGGGGPPPPPGAGRRGGGGGGGGGGESEC